MFLINLLSEVNLKVMVAILGIHMQYIGQGSSNVLRSCCGTTCQLGLIDLN